MKAIRRLDQYLRLRGDIWHYVRLRRVQRGYVKALETEGFIATIEKLKGITGKAHVAAQSGRLIEGTVSQKYELSHGPHAMIETQRAFYLVPWESTHAQKWGKRIKGRVLSGGGIDWDTGRTRGIGR